MTKVRPAVEEASASLPTSSVAYSDALMPNAQTPSTPLPTIEESEGCVFDYLPSPINHQRFLNQAATAGGDLKVRMAKLSGGRTLFPGEDGSLSFFLFVSLFFLTNSQQMDEGFLEVTLLVQIASPT